MGWTQIVVWDELKYYVGWTQIVCGMKLNSSGMNSSSGGMNSNSSGMNSNSGVGKTQIVDPEIYEGYSNNIKYELDF